MARSSIVPFGLILDPSLDAVDVDFCVKIQTNQTLQI